MGLQASISEGKIDGVHDFSVQNGNGCKCALWQQEEIVLLGSLDDLNNVVKKKNPGIVIRKKKRKRNKSYREKQNMIQYIYNILQINCNISIISTK